MTETTSWPVPHHFRDITPEDAARPSRWWYGRTVRLKDELILYPHNFPPGTRFEVMRKWKGLVVKAPACKCCGHIPMLHRQPFNLFELKEYVNDQ